MKNMEKWIEPEAYAISREEYEKDRVVRDVVAPETKMMTMGDCLLALQRMTTRERERSERATTQPIARKHRATAELYESVMFFLRAKNEVIKKMRN